MGLSGLGDLVLTATGDLSRNRQRRPAAGRRASRWRRSWRELGHVAEGVLQRADGAAARARAAASRCRSSTRSSQVLERPARAGAGARASDGPRGACRARLSASRSGRRRRSRSAARPRTPPPRPRCSGSGCAGPARIGRRTRCVGGERARAAPAGSPRGLAAEHQPVAGRQRDLGAGAACRACVKANSAIGRRRRVGEEGRPRRMPRARRRTRGSRGRRGAAACRPSRSRAARPGAARSRCWPRAGSRCRCSAGSRARPGRC